MTSLRNPIDYPAADFGDLYRFTQHRSGAGALCDDDHGGLLQLESAGLFPRGRNRSLLTLEMGRMGNAVGKVGALSEKLSRIGHRRAAALNEDLGLFEVPSSRSLSDLMTS